jgi:hypothetical protein
MFVCLINSFSGPTRRWFPPAKLNAAAVFKSPQEVVSNQELSRQQKIEILRRWEQDATLMEVAEEEGMPGPQPKLLQPIRDALHGLNYWRILRTRAPAKAEKRTARKSRCRKATPFNLTLNAPPQCLIQARPLSRG